MSARIKRRWADYGKMKDYAFSNMHKKRKNFKANIWSSKHGAKVLYGLEKKSYT
jgi:hypothetical protein